MTIVIQKLSKVTKISITNPNHKALLGSLSQQIQTGLLGKCFIRSQIFCFNWKEECLTVFFLPLTWNKLLKPKLQQLYPLLLAKLFFIVVRNLTVNLQNASSLRYPRASSTFPVACDPSGQLGHQLLLLRWPCKRPALLSASSPAESRAGQGPTSSQMS